MRSGLFTPVLGRERCFLEPNRLQRDDLELRAAFATVEELAEHGLGGQADAAAANGAWLHVSVPPSFENNMLGEVWPEPKEVDEFVRKNQLLLYL